MGDQISHDTIVRQQLMRGLCHLRHICRCTFALSTEIARELCSIVALLYPMSCASYCAIHRVLPVTVGINSTTG